MAPEKRGSLSSHDEDGDLTGLTETVSIRVARTDSGPPVRAPDAGPTVVPGQAIDNRGASVAQMIVANTVTIGALAIAQPSPPGTLGRRIDSLPRRPPVFEGREDELTAIHDALRRSSELGGCAALTGMGGVGKTRLALEHAHRCEADYDVRWWVRAGELSALQADLMRLGVELGILTQPDHIEASMREVLAWLSTHERWLVVYDDAEGPASLHALLPSPCRGHVIITSRASAWRSIAEVVELHRLSSQAARAVLVRYGGRSDDGSADEVARSMGHLPLALVQAGAYVDATGCSFREYLQRFAEDGLALLDGDHKIITRTWELSLAQIRTKTPVAAELLDWLAFLDPSGVPIQLLCDHATSMPESLRACVSSPRALDEAIATLRAFGLIERKHGSLRVHQLIGAVTREQLGDRREPWGAAVVRWVCQVFSYELGETLIHEVPLGIPEQIMAVSAIHAPAPADGDSMARALINAGDFYLVLGATQVARTAYVRALLLREAHAAAEPERTEAKRELSLALNRLGVIESRTGNLSSARRYFSQAFELRRELADEDLLSPRSQDDLASSLSKLGDLELLDGDVKAAAQLFAQSVERRGMLVKASPDDTVARRALAHSSRKLGRALTLLGDHDAAHHILRGGLAMVEELAQRDPHDHAARRDLWLLLTDVGNALLHDGEELASRELHERALAIVEELAAEDPENAQARRELSIGLSHWGLAEQRAGHHAEARICLERAVALREALASADPQDAQAQHDLTVSLERLAELDVPGIGAAIQKSVGFVVRWEREDHTRSSNRRLVPEAWTYRDIEPSYRELDRIQMNDYVYALEGFARSALRAGNLHSARQTFLILLSIHRVRAMYDPDSFRARRRVASTLYDLGKTERKRGNLERARDRFLQSLELFLALSGVEPTHVQNNRDLAVCQGKLALLTLRLGDLEGARTLLEQAHEGFVALAALAPSDASALRDLGKSFAQLGAVATTVGNVEQAREHYQRNLDTARAIAELDSSSTDAQLELQKAARLLAELEEP